MQPLGAPPAALSQRWLMLAIALLAQITTSLTTQGVPTLAPFIQADLGLTRGEVGPFGSAVMAGSLAALAAAGWAADAYGERLVLILGNVVVGLFGLAVTRSTTMAGALMLLFAAGAGAAVSTPAGSKTIMYWFPPAQWGTVMGIRQTGIPVAGVLAAATMPALALVFGWRWSAAAGGAACFVAAAVCWASYRRPRASGHLAPRRARQSTGGGLRTILTRDVVLLGVAGALMPLGRRGGPWAWR